MLNFVVFEPELARLEASVKHGGYGLPAVPGDDLRSHGVIPDLLAEFRRKVGEEMKVVENFGRLLAVLAFSF